MRVHGSGEEANSFDANSGVRPIDEAAVSYDAAAARRRRPLASHHKPTDQNRAHAGNPAASMPSSSVLDCGHYSVRTADAVRRRDTCALLHQVAFARPPSRCGAILSGLLTRCALPREPIERERVRSPSFERVIFDLVNTSRGYRNAQLLSIPTLLNASTAISSRELLFFGDRRVPTPPLAQYGAHRDPTLRKQRSPSPRSRAEICPRRERLNRREQNACCTHL